MRELGTTLKTEQEFAQFKHTKAFHSNLFKLRYILRPNQNIPRFGFIVSKKVFAKVTIRNQIKRRLKYIIRANLGKINSADVLLAVKQEIKNKQYSEIERELINLFKSARLWKKS